MTAIALAKCLRPFGANVIISPAAQHKPSAINCAEQADAHVSINDFTRRFKIADLWSHSRTIRNEKTVANNR
jgi:hypothetical protein